MEKKKIFPFRFSKFILSDYGKEVINCHLSIIKYRNFSLSRKKTRPILFFSATYLNSSRNLLIFKRLSATFSFLIFRSNCHSLHPCNELTKIPKYVLNTQSQGPPFKQNHFNLTNSKADMLDSGLSLFHFSIHSEIQENLLPP